MPSISTTTNKNNNGKQPEPIAIIGVGCRFPGGVTNLKEFWQLLCKGVDAITEVPPDRYKIDEYYDPRPATPGKVMSRSGGFLEQVDQFDARFFGISPKEAKKIDPQHRLLMEVAWEAMEDAGLVPSAMSEEDRLRIGVFIGVITGDYWDKQFRDATSLDVYGTAGSAKSGAAGRISYALDLMGPSYALDAACSSALLSVDQAVQNLRTGACSVALAGGVNVILNPDHTIGFSQGRMMSDRCKAYDASADGYVRSEGAGVVVLKPLSQAQADGDRIYAVILGCGSSNDGHGATFMAPETKGQQGGLRKALDDANIDPNSIAYVEAHGPGTQAGDPVEIETLGEKLCAGRPAEHLLYVGSVKTNIGHTEGAAGVAGLIKAVLCLMHAQIPPNLHFREPNPAIPWERYPSITVPTSLTPWPSYGEHPRRALVCSYGIAGTNAYSILEQAPPQSDMSLHTTAPAAQGTALLPLSARSKEALVALAGRYVTHLEDEAFSEQKWSEIVSTAALHRTHHDERLALVSDSKEGASATLAAFAQGQNGPDIFRGRKMANEPKKIAWIFPGQGSQWLGMARDLLAEPVFRASIEQCDQIMSSYVDWSLLEQLQADEASSLLARPERIDVIQPVLFAIEVSLAALWLFWGVEPNAVVGHSMGETAAAYIAGALSLEDAAWIICERSKLLRRTSGQGAMALVNLPIDEAKAIAERYPDRLSVAVSNAPQSTVLSGETDAINALITQLEQRGIFARRINVEVASHSPQMDPLREDLLQLMQRVQPRGKTSVPMLSTVKGTYVEAEDLQAPYWVENLRKPVLFLQATEQLLAEGFTVFMEMSPHPILTADIRQTMDSAGRDGLTLASMRRYEAGRTVMLQALGSLYANGYDPKWGNIVGNASQPVTLPAYPWQRERHWLEERSHNISRSRNRRRDGAPLHPILGEHISFALQGETYLWTTSINAEEFPYLAEHRIHQVPVFPGAAYLELALAAATEIFGAQQFCLEALTLEKALFFPEGVTYTLQVTLTPAEEPGRMIFNVYSQQEDATHPAPSSTWLHHASGRLLREDRSRDPHAPPPVVPEKAEQAWPLIMEAEAFYAGLRARGIEHGPRFQGITRIYQHADEVLARINLPEGIADDLVGYQVHPALMDAILQGICPFLPGGEQQADAYVPVSVQSARLYKPPLADEMWTYVKLRSPQTGSDPGHVEGDVFLLDENGQVKLEIRGFLLQSLESGHHQELLLGRVKSFLYSLHWEQQARSATSPEARERKRWLIFSDPGGVGEQLAAHLHAAGASSVLVNQGSCYRKLEAGRYELPPDGRASFGQLFEDLAGDSGLQAFQDIVYLWGLAPSAQGEVRDEPDAEIGLLHLLQAFAESKQAVAPRLWLVTQGVQAAAAHDTSINVVRAPLWGLGRVIVYEYPDLHSSLIDLPRGSLEEQAATLWEELRADDAEDEVALRGEERYVARIVHQPPSEEAQDSSPQPLFRPDGTYLITGGLGGVGLRTAQWMVEEQGVRHLVLMGRSPASPEALAIVRQLRDTGAQVALMQVDISQRELLQAALAEIRRKLPPLRGVFHSAVVLDDGILQLLNQERYLAVRPPRVDGAWNLHSLTLDDQLDYFVLFSSAASLIGSPGQANYAAASAFLDQLAYLRRQQGRPALCINWGRWGQVGQATLENRGEQLSARGIDPIKPVEGLLALGSLLRCNLAQICVMALDFQRWTQSYQHLAASSLFVHLWEEAAKQEAEGRSRLSREQLSSLSPQLRPQVLASYLCDRIAETLGYTSLQLEGHETLQQLGMESLMFSQLKNSINADLKVMVPFTVFLRGTTLDQLVKSILAEI